MMHATVWHDGLQPGIHTYAALTHLIDDQLTICKLSDVLKACSPASLEQGMQSTHAAALTAAHAADTLSMKNKVRTMTVQGNPAANSCSVPSLTDSSWWPAAMQTHR